MKKINKIVTIIMTSVISLIATPMYAEARQNFGDPTKLGDAVEDITPAIQPLIGTVSAIILYVSIIIIGLNLIIYRNKEEERTNTMTGILYIAIGCFILTSAHFIYDFLMSI